LVEEAELLLCTLSGAHEVRDVAFSVAVVDEAAQCVEPSVLIALRECRQCVMVGDQMQLPPTVFCKQAVGAGYSRSLFQRLVESGHPYILLDTQYRMTPSVSRFPSTTFYGGRLRNG
ncbi:AAA domain-containing protein, partial [Ochromonadaceae sp. CCMP2298]